MLSTGMIKSFSLVLYPSEILTTKANEIKRLHASIPKIIDRMRITMDEHEGVGLAAPQVGIGEQIIIVKDKKHSYAFLNPIIVKTGKKKRTDEEGCLSLPGLFLKIRRSEEVEVQATVLTGERVHIVAKGLGARIFQHEIDHLNGILIIKKISPFAKLKIRSYLKKLTKT